MTNIECVRNKLHLLLKMDYGIEIYNMNENIIRLSFYHLNSCYNAFCTTLCGAGYEFSPSINWQYAKTNKAAEKHVLELVAAVHALHSRNKLELIEKEFAYYKALSEQVFHAKYSTETHLHTWNA